MISIVVPAYNEEKVIERCLRSLTEHAEAGELEVIVACNGCRDRTAELARRFGPPVRVVETATASKTDALNLGDRAATGFPRFYVDADIALSIDAIRKVAKALGSGQALAAAPRAELDLTDRGFLIRAYYQVWTRLQYFDKGMIGSGVYALSREGRQRFDEFPKVISDDGFIYYLFAPSERVTVDSCQFTIRPPVTLKGLMDIRARVHAGRFALLKEFPQLPIKSQILDSAKRVLRDPSLWLYVPVYCAVVAIAKWLAVRRLHAPRCESWTPEQTSREGSITPGKSG